MLNEQFMSALSRCAERLFIVDEVTKEILWTNDTSVGAGKTCHKAFFGKDSPCAFCPELTLSRLYQWDCYDEQNERWLKVKNLLFLDGDRLLRAANLNSMDDVMALSHESVSQLAALQTLLEESHRIKRALESEAIHDRMTGLFNRNQFNMDIASGLYDRAGAGALYFDLNNLKEVNDLYRHEAGDRLIICLADAVAKAAKLPASARTYRIGGDEFVMMINGCTEETLHDTHAYFYDCLLDDPTDPPCIVAVGAALSKASCDGEKLVSDADRAMYADKRRLKGIPFEK